jgi:CubicO group peptidase (beta-lactamase class C family)
MHWNRLAAGSLIGVLLVIFPNLEPLSAVPPLRERRLPSPSQMTMFDSHVPNSACDTTALDSFIIRYMDTNNIAGLSACIVKFDEIMWAQGYGWANIAQSRPVADSTIFMLASISKTVTGSALMQLYEDGLFDLDQNVHDYLPFDVVNPNFPDSIITGRMLLSHVSSLRDNWAVLMPLYVQGDSPIPLGEFLEDYLVPGGRYYDPIENFNIWPPAQGFDYCNVAVTLAGYLVEAITGTPFDQHCEEQIFQPLQMDETSWFLAGLDTNNLAMPYFWNGNSYVPYGFYGYPDYPDGQLRTSASQLARFLTAFMQYGALDTVRILDSATVALMTTIQYPELDPTQGLIWYYVSLGGRQLCGHNGGDAGVSTEMYYCPDENTAVVVLTNGEAWLFEIVDALFDYAETLTAVTDPPAQSQVVSTFRLAGIYPNPFNGQTRVCFELPGGGSVLLTIYDLAGRPVFEQFEGRLSPGTQDIVVDASDLASGVYLCRLSSKERQAWGKLVLVK